MRPHPRGPRPGLLGLIPILVLVAATAAPAARGGTPSEESPADDGEEPAVATWDAVDEAIADQRYREALETVAALREAAAEAGDDVELARALIRGAQLRVALGGFEEAVRTLREAPWPQTALPRTAVELAYADALVNYLRIYGWEIGQRERVATTGEPSLSLWTREQITAEAHRAFARAWSRRGGWGTQPAGRLAPYLEPNDYPPGIRSTLRDTVTYLWVDLLADTGLWATGEESAIHQLDLEGLLADDPGVSGESIADPETHPLLRVVAVLADLEAWHEAGNRPEAGLESRLERVRRLASALSQESDRRRLREDLGERLATFDPAYPWWSEGQDVLAGLLGSEDRADARIDARAAALAGERRHPSSIGGRQCAFRVAAIEAPSLSFASMAVDAPGRRSIQVTHANVERVWLRAYGVTPDDVADALMNRPGGTELRRLLSRGTPDASWSAELPPTPDYRAHRTFLTPPLEGPGSWIVVASARKDFAWEGNHLEGFYLTLGGLALVTRSLEGEPADLKGAPGKEDVERTLLEVEARDGLSGAPLAGVEVELRGRPRRSDTPPVATLATTGEDGRARLQVAARGWEYRWTVLGRHDDDAAVVPNPPVTGSRGGPEREHRGALVYTDRAVYRPGQTLAFKIVAYGGDARGGRFEILPGEAVTVRLRDAGGEEVEVRELVTNDHGSVAGELQLPVGRLPGAWRLETSLGSGASVRVEEYERPGFEVLLDPPSEPVRLNREAAVPGRARLYHGLPVDGGRVQWQVVRAAEFEPLRWGWGWRPQPAPPEIVASGSTRISPDGSFELRFTPEADERMAEARDASWSYRVEATVTDEAGETRSATRTLRAGFVAVRATLERPGGFLAAGAGSLVRVRRTTLDGEPVGGPGCYRLVRLEQPAEPSLPAELPSPVAPDLGPWATPGDHLRPRWEEGPPPETVTAGWTAGESVASGELVHDVEGWAEARLPALGPGVYRLVYRTQDPFGAELEERLDLVVADDRSAAPALPVLLELEDPEIEVGETARLLVASGLEAGELVLELFRDGVRFERRAFPADGLAHIVELPIGAGDRGGVTARLSALADHQLVTMTRNLRVPWTDRRLEIELATFRDTLRPGQEESWRVVVRNADGEPVGAAVAELLASMYDRSLDLFAPYGPPSVPDLYPTLLGAPRIASTQSPAFGPFRGGRRWVSLPERLHLRPDRLKALAAYGIGGPGRGGPPLQRMSAARAEGARNDTPEELRTVTSESPLLKDAETGGAVPPIEPDAERPAEPPGTPRTDFSETAFFLPHLLTAEDGSAVIEFRVPESLTQWSLWVHAITRDLRGGSTNTTVSTTKELMVQPQLPRFFREGDTMELVVAVRNASERALAGTLDLDLENPATGADRLAAFGLDPATAHDRAFTVAPGRSVALTFPVHVPAELGEVAVTAVARALPPSAGPDEVGLSDGERRPLPLLPARMRLVRSRFAALRDGETRNLDFAGTEPLGDPTRVDDSVVVTVDGQLFFSMLRALPYLVEYPRECTEQTLNRFLATGILGSLFDRYPGVAEASRRFGEERREERGEAGRATRYEPWPEDDPNRRMALEETPWLRLSRGGDVPDDAELLALLAPEAVASIRADSLAELQRAQLPSGAFPWWPGGPPSRWMTIYLLHGFSKALEFGVEVPRVMVAKAWRWLASEGPGGPGVDPFGDDCCWESLTLLNYVLSAYPDDPRGSWTGGVFTADDRSRMLDFSYRHWREHSPLLKALLAMTLERAGRGDDAQRVLASVMDSAKTDPDLGTYWAPEERAWLWYNDTIETHALALRALSEVTPGDPRRPGLVQWLMLNRKLNHWKSTRATAEVLWVLAKVLEEEGALAESQRITVEAGPVERTLVYEPGDPSATLEGSGDATDDPLRSGRANQLVFSGPELGSGVLEGLRVSLDGPGPVFASSTWHFSTTELPSDSAGDLFRVERTHYRRVLDGDEWVLEPLDEGAPVSVGDLLEVRLDVTARHAAEYVHLRDPRPAGFEPDRLTSGFDFEGGVGVYTTIRDSGAEFFLEWLPAGTVTLRHRLRATHAGTFRTAPAQLQSMYAPEFAGYSAGAVVEVGAADAPPMP